MLGSDKGAKLTLATTIHMSNEDDSYFNQSDRLFFAELNNQINDLDFEREMFETSGSSFQQGGSSFLPDAPPFETLSGGDDLIASIDAGEMFKPLELPGEVKENFVLHDGRDGSRTDFVSGFGRNVTTSEAPASKLSPVLNNNKESLNTPNSSEFFQLPQSQTPGAFLSQPAFAPDGHQTNIQTQPLQMPVQVQMQPMQMQMQPVQMPGGPSQMMANGQHSQGQAQPMMIMSQVMPMPMSGQPQQQHPQMMVPMMMMPRQQGQVGPQMVPMMPQQAQMMMMSQPQPMMMQQHGQNFQAMSQQMMMMAPSGAGNGPVGPLPPQPQQSIMMYNQNGMLMPMPMAMSHSGGAMPMPLPMQMSMQVPVPVNGSMNMPVQMQVRSTVPFQPQQSFCSFMEDVKPDVKGMGGPFGRQANSNSRKVSSIGPNSSSNLYSATNPIDGESSTGHLAANENEEGIDRWQAQSGQKHTSSENTSPISSHPSASSNSSDGTQKMNQEQGTPFSNGFGSKPDKDGQDPAMNGESAGGESSEFGEKKAMVKAENNESILHNSISDGDFKNLLTVDEGGDCLTPLAMKRPPKPTGAVGNRFSASMKSGMAMPRSFSSHSLGQLGQFGGAEGAIKPQNMMIPGPSQGVISPLPLPSPTFGFAGMRRVQSTGDLMGGGAGLSMVPMSSPMMRYDDRMFRIGRYTMEERKLRISRYRQKRAERNFNKKIKYACRKTLAEGRPRVKGRFARNGELDENEVEEGFDELLLDDASSMDLNLSEVYGLELGLEEKGKARS